MFSVSTRQVVVLVVSSVLFEVVVVAMESVESSSLGRRSGMRVGVV